MTCNVYWIRCKDHTDMFNQGYIGVSTNVEKRWVEHKEKTHNVHLKNAILKYGWDNLVKSVLVIADEKYCYDIEAALRKEKQTGWNISEGGNRPPKLCDDLNHMREAHHIERQRDIMLSDKNPMRGKGYLRKGDKNTMYGRTEGDAPSARKICVDGIVYASIKTAANALGINYGKLQMRVHRHPEQYEVVS